jgi:hypothetical protein
MVAVVITAVAHGGGGHAGGDRPQPANAAEMAVDSFWLLPAIALTARLLFHNAACAHLENPSRKVGLSEGLIGDLKSRIE